MAGGKKARGCEAPAEDQEWFIRENAVALVRQRDAKIVRLRKRITDLDRAGCERKRLIRILSERVAVQAELLGKRAEREILSDRVAAALALSDPGTQAFFAAFGEQDVPGWRVVEKIREVLNGS
jgi:hypothetical protein